MGDQIWVWDGNTVSDFYWLMDGIDWDQNRSGKWWSNRTGTYGDFQLEPGKAYFYRHHGSGTNFIWSP